MFARCKKYRRTRKEIHHGVEPGDGRFVTRSACPAASQGCAGLIPGGDGHLVILITCPAASRGCAGLIPGGDGHLVVTCPAASLGCAGLIPGGAGDTYLLSYGLPCAVMGEGRENSTIIN